MFFPQQCRPSQSDWLSALQTLASKTNSKVCGLIKQAEATLPAPGFLDEKNAKALFEFIWEKANRSDREEILHYRTRSDKPVFRPIFGDILMSTSNFLTRVFLLYSAHHHDLETSSWTPHMTAKKTFKYLQKHGPFLIRGKFGPEFYESAPLALKEKIQGKTIWGWSKGADRKNLSVIKTVLLIGATTHPKQSRVYFFCPEQGDNSKIFAVSFTNLTTHIVNFVGQSFPKIAGNDALIYSNGEPYSKSIYALYHPTWQQDRIRSNIEAQITLTPEDTSIGTSSSATSSLGKPVNTLLKLLNDFSSKLLSHQKKTNLSSLETTIFFSGLKSPLKKIIFRANSYAQFLDNFLKTIRDSMMRHQLALSSSSLSNIFFSRFAPFGPLVPELINQEGNPPILVEFLKLVTLFSDASTKHKRFNQQMSTITSILDKLTLKIPEFKNVINTCEGFLTSTIEWKVSYFLVLVDQMKSFIVKIKKLVDKADQSHQNPILLQDMTQSLHQSGKALEQFRLKFGTFDDESVTSTINHSLQSAADKAGGSLSKRVKPIISILSGEKQETNPEVLEETSNPTPDEQFQQFTTQANDIMQQMLTSTLEMLNSSFAELQKATESMKNEKQ